MMATRRRAAGQDAGAETSGWIDPDWLEEKCEDCECGLCFGVMVEPASGCPEGHSFCRSCFVKELHERKRCPTCRHPVTDEHHLVRNRTAEGMIAKLRLRRCEHGEGGTETGPPAAKRAKLAPAASMPVEALRKELRQRGLETAGNKPALVARLEEDRRKGAGCGWRGCVGELAAHLLGECEWAPVKCPHAGCTESPLRRDLAAHEATCEHRLVCCRYCQEEMKGQTLKKHEKHCSYAPVECPNKGCSAVRSGLTARSSMQLHRLECEHEEVPCPCPGCDARLLRKDVDAHLEATHLGAAAAILKSAWSQNAESEKQLQRLKRENGMLRATLSSEHRLASPTPTSWVFNWRADGLGPGKFESEPHLFGEGTGVTGHCVLIGPVSQTDPFCIGLDFDGRTTCRVHATFSILDKHDKPLRTVAGIGTAWKPSAQAGGMFSGSCFTVTADDRAKSVRADGSIRLRAVVRLFLDSAA